ncbi:hypothetical protein SO802_026305 [Lithocarpus litseifolius]|uniref:Oil body-associated protein 1A n=1 Tax=Lithocarpus litseifolius TaxID=425828 RepID=A0AAW2C4J8_9ROSI
MSTTYPVVPGEPTQTGTAFLETATATIPSFAPINKIHQHLCAFHFYAYDMSRQVEAHHYCAHQNEEVRQCIIYDSPEANAGLIGVEYIVSENLFLTLPDEEKYLWHSHEYEVKSGVLFMLGVPASIQRQDMEKVVKTYGKVFNFWQVDKGDNLPLGLPQFMMVFTSDGQLYEQLIKDYQRQTKQEKYTEKSEHLRWNKVKKKHLLCWDKGEEEAVVAATGSG